MRLLLLFLFSSTIFCCHAQTFNLLIGTYTGTGSKGIYVYRFNATAGVATWVSNTDSVTNPSYLAISRNGKYVYAVNETNGDNPGTVSSFAFDKAIGKLNFINRQLSGGGHPCYISESSDNKWVAVGNYSGGNFAILPVNENGELQPYAQLIQHSGSSVNNQREEKAHVHAAVFSPDGAFLFTPDLGIDKIMIYKFTPASDTPLQPAAHSFVSTTAGNGPRHFTFHPDNKFAYLVEELSGTVAAYSYNNGNLKFLQRISTHPKNYKGTIGSADIHISPDGKFLYASNRGDANTITIFSINKITGKLVLKGYQPTLGKAPRNFIIDPTGNYLLAANQNTDNIVIFKRNKLTGLLKNSGKQIKIPKPVCLKMIKL